MKLVARKMLRDFWARHSDAKGPLTTWFQPVRQAEWIRPADICALFRSADFVGHNCVIFDIGGNKYRHVVHVSYPAQIRAALPGGVPIPLQPTLPIRRYDRANIPDVVDVKAIRQRIRLSQAKFATHYGFSPASIKNWEQGRRQPDVAARAYLLVIANDPEAVDRALSTQ